MNLPRLMSFADCCEDGLHRNTAVTCRDEDHLALIAELPSDLPDKEAVYT